MAHGKWVSEGAWHLLNGAVRGGVAPVKWGSEGAWHMVNGSVRGLGTY